MLSILINRTAKSQTPLSSGQSQPDFPHFLGSLQTSYPSHSQFHKFHINSSQYNCSTPLISYGTSHHSCSTLTLLGRQIFSPILGSVGGRCRRVFVGGFVIIGDWVIFVGRSGCIFVILLMESFNFLLKLFFHNL